MMLEKKDEVRLLLRYPAIKEMVLAAEQRGKLKGQQKVITELLGRLFVRRVERWPTTEEERSIMERASAIGISAVVDALLDLERDSLVRWLAEPVRRPDLPGK